MFPSVTLQKSDSPPNRTNTIQWKIDTRKREYSDRCTMFLLAFLISKHVKSGGGNEAETEGKMIPDPFTQVLYYGLILYFSS